MTQNPALSLEEFKDMMQEELDFHDDENTSNHTKVPLDDLVNLLIHQSLKRVHLLKKAQEECNEKQIIKQSTHLANFCYFVAARATAVKANRDLGSL